MAIKKPLTKKSSRPSDDDEDEVPKKPLKKKAPVDDDDTGEGEGEEEEEETPLQRKKRLREEAESAKSGKKKKAPVDDDDADPEEEEEEEPKPRKGSGKKKKAKQSFADIFDSTKPGRGTFPVGDYNAIVSLEIVGEIAAEDEEQGELKVIASFTGANNDDEEVDDKKIGRQQYILCTEDGEAGPGIQWLKGDLDVLGYEDVAIGDLEEIVADIEADEPVVVIRNKEKGGYVNSYIQGLAEAPE